jgi:arylsulfatase A-like enzyme
VIWPAQVKGGRALDTPVISLDILPTALEAAGLLGVAPSGGTGPAEAGTPNFDGRSLLPVLRGETKTLHEHLFWSEGGASGEWAVRSGDWKLVAGPTAKELFNLATDPAEAANLAVQHPDRVKQLTALYDAWLDQMAAPNSGQPKRHTGEAAGKAKKMTPEQKKKAREVERAKKKAKGD